MKHVVEILFCIILFSINHISAQQSYVTNLSIENGLPVNYTYCLFVDDYGYLWIASTKGVIRYNGYSSKLYNYTTGILKDDIWRFYQDKKRRIWLSAISNHLSYIKNNKYHTIYNSTKNTLYPSKIIDYDDGIFFVSTHSGPDDYAIWIEKNDTLFAKHIQGLAHVESTHTLVNGDNIVTFNGGICYITPIDFLIKDTIHCRPVATVRNCLKVNYNTDIIGSNVVSFTKNEKTLNVINYHNYSIRDIDLGKKCGLKNGIQRVALYNDSYDKHQMLAIITTNEVYITDSSFVIIKIGNLDSLYGKTHLGDKASFFIYDSLWRKCLSTINNGIFINHGIENKFVRIPINLKDYKYIGNASDAIAYWWNEDNKTLLRLSKNNSYTPYKINNLSLVQNIIPYRNDSVILVSNEYIFWFKNKSFKLNPFISVTPNAVQNAPAYARRKYPFGGYSLIVNDTNNFYVISKERGFVNFFRTTDSLSVKYINNKERFDGMVYDSVRNEILIYNNDDIEVYRESKLIHSYTADSLSALKINNIEKISVDNKYGNIFIKEYNRLIVFTDDIHHYKTLLDNYMLNDAGICIYKNKLIVAGKFGILFSEIKGAFNFSKSLLYPNIKAQVYNYITDMQTSDDKVLINTDKGTFAIQIPNDSTLNAVSNASLPDFKVIISYNDSLKSLHQQDTIAFLKQNISLQFDIINPTGTGIPQFEYYMTGTDSSWHQMNSNELLIPDLVPGKYYRMALRIHDDTWKSNIIDMQLYLIPNWWQKSIWKNTFFVTGILLVLLFVYVIILVTRKMVISKNRKKNLQLELELKAIYSQINPHFIYNTLNSALLLINNNNMSEAYLHVSKFSKLLRAYVKSSRNKYITIEDEIANLKNYIELQQTRFKNRFKYHIKVDSALSIVNVKIPSLLLQPFVENAINHGILHKEEEGNLTISFSLGQTINELHCVIEDDGIGRNESKKLYDNSDPQNESYGNELIKKLIEIFKNYERLHIEVTYTDKKLPLTGTIVKINIKYPTHEHELSLYNS